MLRKTCVGFVCGCDFYWGSTFNAAWYFRLADVVKGTAKPKGQSSHSSASSSSSASKEKEIGSSSSPRTLTPPPQTSQVPSVAPTASSQTVSQPHHTSQAHAQASLTSAQPCVHSGISTSSGNDSSLATVAMTPPSSPEKYKIISSLFSSFVCLQWNNFFLLFVYVRVVPVTKKSCSTADKSTKTEDTLLLSAEERVKETITETSSSSNKQAGQV